MANLLSSASDAICPTFAAGTFALMSSASSPDILNDSVAPGGTAGYVNSFPSFTVGSFNNDWNNSYLTQTKTPTFSSGLLSFGNTGLQS